MKLERWLFGALAATALACGAESGEQRATRDDPTSADDDGDESGDESSDDGKNRDAGRAPLATNDDDDDDDGVPDDADSDVDESVCDSVSIQAKPNSPEILIVLDRSGSMIGSNLAPDAAPVNRWDPSAGAVKKITQDLNGVVSFGLMLFPNPTGQGGMPGTIEIVPGVTIPAGNGAQCAPGGVDVPVMLSSADAIAGALDNGPPDRFGSTPTAATLDAAYKELTSNDCADCPVAPKYVLLVTDGQPTCGAGGTNSTPEDVAATNAAIDKLKAADIGTYVIGYDTQADMALATVMDGFAMHGGTGTHLAVDNEQQLVDELKNIATALVSCEYELNTDVDNPALVRVIIDDEELVLGQGWGLEGRKVTLEGACEKIKDGKPHIVKIRRDCEEQIFR